MCDSWNCEFVVLNAHQPTNQCHSRTNQNQGTSTHQAEICLRVSIGTALLSTDVFKPWIVRDNRHDTLWSSNSCYEWITTLLQIITVRFTHIHYYTMPKFILCLIIIITYSLLVQIINLYRTVCRNQVDEQFNIYIIYPHRATYMHALCFLNIERNYPMQQS